MEINKDVIKTRCEKIIKESIRLGWKNPGSSYGTEPVIKVIKSLPYIREGYLIIIGDAIVVKLSSSDIFFNHDWGKVVFGEILICCECDGEKFESISDHGDCWESSPAYIYHLSELAQLETDEERINYVYKFMFKEKDETSKNWR